MLLPDPRVRARSPLLLVTMVLVAVNLRPALAAVGPILDEIRFDMHVSVTTLALLTALPVACFGLLAPLAPPLVRRFGLERSLIAALAVLLAGMLLRLGPNLATLLAGTAILGGGIAVANVLLPALVKRDFSHRPGPVTGVYSIAMNLGAAAAAGTVVPLGAAIGHGWRGGLAAWALPVVAALAVLLPMARAAPPAAAVTRTRGTTRGMAGDKRVRQIIAFTASQSVIYYSVLSWLPSIYISHGLSPTSAGLLLSVTTLTSAPVALVLPTMAARRAGQRGYVAIIACCAGAGLLGVLFAATTAPYLWAVLLGIGMGGAFPLALILFVLRTRDAAETARLSTLAQTAAYLVAAAGPLALGVLHDATGSWNAGIGLLIVCAVVEFFAGLGAARAGYIGPGPPTKPNIPETGGVTVSLRIDHDDVTTPTELRSSVRQVGLILSGTRRTLTRSCSLSWPTT